MDRQILTATQLHVRIRDQVANNHLDIVREVQQAVASQKLVVVGMALNPYPRQARKLLDAAGISYRYLQYGSYLSDWRRRTALKMWTGWPTFPMIFVGGTLIGGASDLQVLLNNGEFKQMLAES